MLFKPWKFCFDALLLDPTEAKILIRSSNDNYCLPGVEINQKISLDNFKAIKEAIEFGSIDNNPKLSIH